VPGCETPTIGWSAEQIPDQSGRSAIVTGSNSGIGLSAARELARAGAQVVLACRNTDKAEAAEREIRSAARDADVEVAELDLASLESVREFASGYRERRDGPDLLINNAGVMAPPRGETRDGFELQFGTNHLGHFVLTGSLLGAMQGRPDARVVTVTSTAHWSGRIRFDDLQGERRYQRWLAYGQSKAANILFALELDRRLRAAGSEIRSVAAHPGYAATELQHTGPTSVESFVLGITNRVFAQSADMGALPTLYAATAPGVEGGELIGPGGIAEQRGHPKPVPPRGQAGDEEAAARLWEVSEELTGVEFDLAAGAAA
jgi:NAD(P)-dependent dehydrogenase (short-subunit alcohol dehydrogenase family)